MTIVSGQDIEFRACQRAVHSQAMLTEAYIEALLVDEELADMVWELWDQGEINDEIAATA